MKQQVFKHWNRVRSSFWFTPTVMVATAVALALGRVSVDDSATAWLTDSLNWRFKSGPEGSSAVLGTIAASMITSENTAFVPHLSVSLGVVLAVATVGVLIYFSGQRNRRNDQQGVDREGLPEGEDRRVVEGRWQAVVHGVRDPRGGVMGE